MSTVWAAPLYFGGGALIYFSYYFKEDVIMKKVGIIMGSDSDLPVVEKAIKVLKDFDVPYEVHVYSAHRTPKEAKAFAELARENNFGVIICAAGMAAHLAGAFAANTTLPVIGIPVKSAALDGMDALLSTVQMPTGIPVATVAINGAANAAFLAVQILGVADTELAKKLNDRRVSDAKAVLEKDAAVSAQFNN
jgi:5-(carboxyamino)imidazole ribonucleotide mutase